MKTSSKVLLALLGAGILAGGVVAAKAGSGGWHGGPGGFGKRFAMMKLMQSDLDGDGVITREELAKAKQQRFGRMDANGDGKVDTTELDTAIMKRLERKKVRIRYRLLGRLDRNGDGVIGKQEFMQAGKRLFARLDADGDGRITRAELAQARRHGMMGRKGMMRRMHQMPMQPMPQGAQ